MGTLSRYQKAGGFIQLLQLIETCGKTKQDSFFHLIDKEDRRWGMALREKMITMEKLFAWDDSVLAELAARLPPLTLAIAMHGFKPEESERMLKTLSSSQKRNINELFTSNRPIPAEISAAYLKIIQETRAMISGKHIKPEKFAPAMVIPQDIEEAISSGALITKSEVNTFSRTQNDMRDALASAPEPHAHQPKSSSIPEGGDLNSLRARVLALTNENAQLQGEVRTLRDRLDHLRKIA